MNYCKVGVRESSIDSVLEALDNKEKLQTKAFVMKTKLEAIFFIENNVPERAT